MFLITFDAFADCPPHARSLAAPVVWKDCASSDLIAVAAVDLIASGWLGWVCLRTIAPCLYQPAHWKVFQSQTARIGHTTRSARLPCLHHLHHLVTSSLTDLPIFVYQHCIKGPICLEYVLCFTAGYCIVSASPASATWATMRVKR